MVPALTYMLNCMPDLPEAVRRVEATVENSCSVDYILLLGIVLGGTVLIQGIRKYASSLPKEKEPKSRLH
ncbi:MAG: hypothetical protein NT076_03390 [Candidatus Pacearchaeota archaeon]|nr:hypothetical protein [Candidatus Pacearchaeota archaeon]